MFVSLSPGLSESGTDTQPLATPMYDDIIKTFTSNGVVDEETQRNDLAVVKDVAQVPTDIPIQKANDVSSAHQAEQLNKAGWKA
jgi:hypothetical protein